MIKNEEIEKLKEQIKQGEEAKRKLNEYNSIKNKIDFLEKEKNDIENNKMLTIKLEKSYNSFIEIEIEDKKNAKQLIATLIENEIRILKNKLQLL